MFDFFCDPLENKICSIQSVEWILVHRFFTCNNKNPLILAALIIFQQNLKHESCRVKK
jgi:hypothetical protein